MSKKDDILNIAESLFNNFGYIAVGVDLIRDQAGVSKTSMYRYFGSKNKLIEAVLERRHQRFMTELNAVVAASSNTEDKLDAIFDWHFQWFSRSNFKGCMFMHALAEFKEVDEPLSTLAVQHKHDIKALLISIFEPQQKHIAERAEALMAFLEGTIIRAEFEDILALKGMYCSTAKQFIHMPFE